MESILAARSDPQMVLAALKNAAAATGSDFHYLLGTAMRESSLKPDARSGTSSAAGLFQFVDQTWMGLIKDHGAQYGLSGLADAIAKGSDGRYRAAPAERQTILSLRSNPQLSALMAGEYAKTTQSQLKAALGREVCGGELYAAHFLGPESACRLIRLADQAPGASAAAQFPQAAGANRSVFYHPDGQAKTVREVYDWALRQPGEEGTSRLPPAAAPAVTVNVLPAAQPQKKDAMITAANAGDAEVRMLLASVMNWQPGHGFFGGGEASRNVLGGADAARNLLSGADAPRTGALSLNAGLLGLLSDSKS